MWDKHGTKAWKRIEGKTRDRDSRIDLLTWNKREQRETFQNSDYEKVSTKQNINSVFLRIIWSSSSQRTLLGFLPKMISSKKIFHTFLIKVTTEHTNEAN